MPAKFRVKRYIEDGVYHIYNKGVDGRDIFLDDVDFNKFEEILGKYLTRQPSGDDNRFKGDRPYRVRHKQEMNLKEEIEIWAYCLMPNHFHLLIKQKNEKGIVKLMRRVMTYYVMYFNQKYHRQGTLFSGVYRAVNIEEGIPALKLSRYIHLNPVQRSVKRFGPVETVTGSRPGDYLYSSYQAYLKKRDIPWVNMSSLVKICNGDYTKYVEDPKGLADDGLEGLTLE